MDVISGIVVSTSVFMLSMALVVLCVTLPAARQPGPGSEAKALAQRVMATSLVVYFAAVLNLLLIAQQTSLALGTFVVGLLLLVVFYVEPALRSRGSEGAEEAEGWGEK